MSRKIGKMRLALAVLTIMFLVGQGKVVAGTPDVAGISDVAGTFEVEGSVEEAGNEAESVPEPLEKLSLYATAAVLMDADSGRVLYEKNGFTRMAMASTTKIMTCIVALENCSEGAELAVSAYAASMPKVKLYVRQGETYTMKDLLYSLMLESHNDSAVVIAEHIGRGLLSEESQKGSAEYTVEESKQAVAAFAGMMNQKAAEIGCKDTWFITPNGLDATQTFYPKAGGEIVKEHSTTAADLAAIMAYCINESPMKEKFLEITRTSSYSFSANGRSFNCSNHNAFLTMMDGALSGKTGFTNKAGYCYVGALERDGRTFTVALLACGWPNHKTYKWSDTRDLMEYGLAHYSYHSFEELPVDTQKLQPVLVVEGCTDRLGEEAYVEMVLAKGSDEGGTEEVGTGDGLLLREDERFELRYSLPDVLKAPVAAGTQVGKVEYLLGDQVLKTVPVVTKSDVKKIDFMWCFQQIWNRYIFL